MAVEHIHATAIAAGGRAALIRGPSGSGKSDLALRCLMTAEGPLVPLRAELIADDQVLVERAGDRLLARPPVAIAGHLEVRGLGIVGVPHVNAVPVEVFLVVDLVQTPASVERLPDPWPHTVLAGVRLPLLTLRPFEASAPLKLLLALISPSLPPLVQ